MTTQPENLLVCSTAGKVYALNKTDGSQVWKSELSGLGYGVGSLFVSGDKVYVGMNGYLISLNLVNGAEIWRNSLTGMRYNEISLLVTAVEAETKSYVVIIASFGKVCGIRSESGETIWQNGLKGGGYFLPALMLDSSALDTVWVGCGKQLYKINIYNGQTIFQKKISNDLFGPPYVTMATHQSSLQAAFTYTGFNNNPIAQYAIKEKEEEKRRNES
jgi:outer membrane protein assembly factor BamB